jgi:rSAM/selenodomain-associated transferase 1
MSHLLGVFGKAPVPGRVKTRTLLPPEQAALLQEALLLDTLSLARQLSSVETRFFAAEDPSHPFLEKLQAEQGLVVHEQVGASLGERMRTAMQSCGVLSGDAVCLIGSDSPHLPLSYLQEAFVRLSSVSVVLGPANDGGYYLIGLRGVLPEIFDGIAWGTEEVLPETLRRLETAQISYELLPFWYDIDLPNDLRFLKAHLPWLRRRYSVRCEAVGRFLSSHSL